MDSHSAMPHTVSRQLPHPVVALVDGAVVNALIEIHSDPRATARRMLRTFLAE
ncbi:hypothetical protein ACFQ1S_17880 [Kibdelosporangium lantanae]|uniref:FXSXX-COOH protein n=1 Tax=Kibdelosporangium lantanae TaxID=1497396 RepID=A0ABW3M994_9PSEU